MIRVYILAFLALCSCDGAVQSSLPAAEENKVASLDSATHYLNLVDQSILSPKGYTRAAMHFVAQDSLIKTKAEYLMKAGLTCMNQEGEYRLYGVNYLILLSNKFPQDDYAPQALLQLALFFDNVLGDSERATEFLRALIQRYPESSLREDAEGLLNLINVSETGEIEQVRQWLKTK
jgi:hypothetical protein